MKKSESCEKVSATAAAADAPLSPKQLAFCQEYLVDLNATQAARRAGYSALSACRQASDLLKHARVSAEIDRLMAERSLRTRITADLVLRELLLIARLDPAGAFAEDGSILPMHEMPEEIRRSVSFLDVTELFEGKGAERSPAGHAKKLKFCDKLKALELLGKHLRLFTEKIELTGEEGGPVKMQSSMSPEQSAALDDYLATLRAGLVPPGRQG